MSRGKTAEWKDRFTERQLERKRLVDRVGQRRTRDQLKHTVLDLTARVELLSQGHSNVIVERLLAENDQLKDRLNEYKSKMATICRLSSGCEGTAAEPPVLPPSPARNSKEDLAVAKASKSLEASISSVAKDLPFFSAILFCRSSPSEDDCASPASTIISEHELLDLIMSWKLSAAHGLGFQFLLRSLGLDREPMLLTPEYILDRVRRKDFYHAIVDGLCAEGEDAVPLFAAPMGPDQLSVPEIECQRRAVMLCAYEITVRWRRLFTSKLEYHAQFWSLYRLFMLLSFPSEDNLNRTPKWIRPSRSQLMYPHPGFIDCIPWPGIRDYLLHAWHKHNAQALCVTFARCLELNAPNHNDITTTLLVAPNGASIELDPLYRDAISTMGNFKLNDDFSRLFPEIASSLNAGPAPAKTLEQPTGEDVIEVERPRGSNGELDTGDSTKELPVYHELSHISAAFPDFDMDSSISAFGTADFNNLFPMPIHGSLFSAANLSQLTP